MNSARAGTSTTTYSSVAALLTIANPMPSSCIRAATSMSGPDGSRRPDGWLCTSISPVLANPGSASTLRTSPRETTRAVCTTPLASTRADEAHLASAGESDGGANGGGGVSRLRRADRDPPRRTVGMA